MTTSHHIRPASPDDAAGISELLHGIGWFKAYEGRSIAQNTAAVRQLLLDAQTQPERSLLLVAENAQQRIHGYCAVHWLPVCLSWRPLSHELSFHSPFPRLRRLLMQRL